MKPFVFLTLIILLAAFGVAQELPIGLQKIQEANEQVARDTLENTGILIAFLAGITTLLSPCILPLLPAFFAYTFKEQKQITRMTFVFFLGFGLVFSLMGIGAVLAGNMLTAIVENTLFVTIAGWLLILLGAMSFFGKGFTGIMKPSHTGRDTYGVFFAGLLFAAGWTACVGPILSGILLMVSTFQNYATAFLLMFSYSLGVFVPLLVLSLCYDKYDLSRYFRGKQVLVDLGDKKLALHTNNMLAGTLLAAMGIIFVIYGGTSVFNNVTFATKDYFYTFQYYFQEHLLFANIFGATILVFLAALLWRLKDTYLKPKQEK